MNLLAQRTMVAILALGLLASGVAAARPASCCQAAAGTSTLTKASSSCCCCCRGAAKTRPCCQKRGACGSRALAQGCRCRHQPQPPVAPKPPRSEDRGQPVLALPAVPAVARKAAARFGGAAEGFHGRAISGRFLCILHCSWLL